MKSPTRKKVPGVDEAIQPNHSEQSAHQEPDTGSKQYRPTKMNTDSPSMYRGTEGNLRPGYLAAEQNIQNTGHRAAEYKGIQLTKGQTGRTAQDVEQWKRLTHLGRTQERKV